MDDLHVEKWWYEYAKARWFRQINYTHVDIGFEL